MSLRLATSLMRGVLAACAAVLLLAAGDRPAGAQALLLVDADSGRVLHAEHAGQPWYPASVTKVMTTYVTLHAVKAGRLRLDSLIPVSTRAAVQQPSKMGFAVGTRMTVGDALLMLMVRSANDVAVVLAEAVSGSVEAFAAEMNQHSARLGMTQSRWVNPNGLPDDGQVSSARDLAILARAMMREFPQHSIYWRASSIQVGRRVFRNYNRLIDRYPGADGMKTGFICASGYNLLATATRNGRRLIAVVLGSPSGLQRAETAARLLERGFSGGALAWLMPSLGTVEKLQPVAAEPPNLREDICGGRYRGKVRTDHAEEENADGQAATGITAFASAVPGFLPSGERGPLIGDLVESAPPIRISVLAPGAPSRTSERGRERGKPAAKPSKGDAKEAKSVPVPKPAKR